LCFPDLSFPVSSLPVHGAVVRSRQSTAFPRFSSDFPAKRASRLMTDPKDTQKPLSHWRTGVEVKGGGEVRTPPPLKVQIFLIVC